MTHEFLFKNTFLHSYLDKSNFKVLSKEGLCDPGDLGFLKSEISDNVVEEVICLSPKCYSILSYERESGKKDIKSAVKGCPTRVGVKVYNHEIFRKVLKEEGYTSPHAISNHIRRDPATGVNTVRVKKT